MPGGGGGGGGYHSRCSQPPSVFSEWRGGSQDTNQTDALQEPSPPLSLTLGGLFRASPRCRLGPNTVQPSWARGCPWPALPPAAPAGLCPLVTSPSKIVADMGAHRCWWEPEWGGGYARSVSSSSALPTPPSSEAPRATGGRFVRSRCQAPSAQWSWTLWVSLP